MKMSASCFFSFAVAVTLLLTFETWGANLQKNEDSATLLRGEKLAMAADCNACHRSSKPFGPDYSGGLPLVSPMGKIIAPNITPSVKYGIGQYSEKDFRRALVDGIRRDGSYLYPAMPYTAYRGIENADLQALYLYFMHGVKPVDKPAPKTKLAFPFSIRKSMWFWNLFYCTQPKPVRELDNDELIKGYYLVEILEHCSACHTPRNFLMAEDNIRRFAGNSIGGWYAPNITSDKISGIGDWSDSELVQYLKTGHVEGKSMAAGGMGEAVEYSLSAMPHKELQDIVAYLRQIPPVRDAGEVHRPWQSGFPLRTGHNPDNSAGEKLYESACAACHRLHGEGAYADHFPSLTQNSTTHSLRADNLVMVILNGINRQGEFTPITMPAFGEALNDRQIADLSNYVLQRFGNPALSVTDKFVEVQRNGGEKPLIIRLLPWVYGLALVVVLWGLAIWLRKRSARIK